MRRFDSIIFARLLAGKRKVLEVRGGPYPEEGTSTLS
jgi:hypothetical protein